MKTTEWFPDSVTPIHEGLYETRVGDGWAWSLREGALTWSVWRDGFWHFASSEKEECIKMAALGSKSFWQKREWRGLKEQA